MSNGSERIPETSDAEVGTGIVRRALERRKVGVTVVESTRYEVEPSLIFDELAHRLTAYLLADHIADDTFTARTRVEWPETTWQMFKSRHASSWWLRWLVERRPVRMHVERRDVAVEIQRYLGYPEAAISIQQLGSPFIFETARQVDWTGCAS